MSVTTGFSSPVFDSQRAFRAIMDAMARPGSIQNVALDLAPPNGFPVAAAASVLALCDFETSLWVAPDLENASQIIDYCVFQTGCTRAKTAKDAAFAVVDLACQTLHLEDYFQGTAEYPDRATTLIALVPSLTSGPLCKLYGAGINGETNFSVSGLPHDFTHQWALNRAGFPLGIDIIFCAGSSILALPRSAQMEGR